jgi:dienelactone hydrolase
MTALRWIGNPLSNAGVTERRFDIKRELSTIPGNLWTPTHQTHPVPLVLIGHGGSGHKRAERQLLLAQHFAGVANTAAVAIDGPFHGERVTTPLEPHQYQEMITAMGVDKVIDGMIDDWRATLNAVSQLDMINPDRVAYLGLSMGTRFGLPFAAAMGNRLRCAILGKNGMRAPTEMNTAPRFTQDAPKITVPILFHVQWDDELFPRAGQFELFDLLGTQDKQLIAFTGSHNTTPPAAVRLWCQFIADHLAE